MVKHFISSKADAGSIPADILYVALDYLILNKNIIMKSYPSEMCLGNPIVSC